jgi:hypothetical protein
MFPYSQDLDDVRMVELLENLDFLFDAESIFIRETSQVHLRDEQSDDEEEYRVPRELVSSFGVDCFPDVLEGSRAHDEVGALEALIRGGLASGNVSDRADGRPSFETGSFCLGATPMGRERMRPLHQALSDTLIPCALRLSQLTAQRSNQSG